MKTLLRARGESERQFRRLMPWSSDHGWWLGPRALGWYKEGGEK